MSNQSAFKDQMEFANDLPEHPYDDGEKSYIFLMNDCT